jgi:hypothetical protein
MSPRGVPRRASTSRSQLALDLVHEVQVELKEPSQEVDYQQEVRLSVRELVSALFAASSRHHMWGPHDRNDLEAMKAIVRPFMPPRPADAPPEPDYSEPGVLEDIAARAGLEPKSAFDTTWFYEFPDDDTIRRALVAPAGIAVLVGPDREDEVKDAIVSGLAAYRAADGCYRLRASFHTLIARAL